MILKILKYLDLFQKPKLLIFGKKSFAGRNNFGKQTFFHQRIGRKISYRFVDFFRSVHNVPAIVRNIEKDPTRSSALALISYSNETLSYILAPAGIEINQIIFSCEKNTINKKNFRKFGYASTLKDFAIGSFIHAIEAIPGQGAQYMRANGSAAQLIRKFGDSSILKLRSGEHRRFSNKCMASFGVPSSFSFLHTQRIIRKAGLSFHLGKRPIVRGCAMNPIDHPHGGNTSSKFGSFTPWGKISKGKRTAKYKTKNSNVIKERTRKILKKF